MNLSPSRVSLPPGPIAPSATPAVHKRVHQQWIELALLERKMSAVECLFASTHCLHQRIVETLPEGIDGVLIAQFWLHDVFTRWDVEIEEQIAHGDRCLTRFQAHAKQTGELSAMQPSGRWVTFRVTVLSRFERGLMMETWIEANALEVVVQLDALEATDPAVEQARTSVETAVAS